MFIDATIGPGRPGKWSVTCGPIHLIRYRGKSKTCWRRIEKNERSKYLATQGRLAEVAVIDSEEDEED